MTTYYLKDFTDQTGELSLNIKFEAQNDVAAIEHVKEVLGGFKNEGTVLTGGYIYRMISDFECKHLPWNDEEERFLFE